jgi:hypothetical protein
MKIIYLLFAVSLLALAGCSTAYQHQSSDKTAGSETVMIIYHVKPGKVVELQMLLDDAWQHYLDGHLVYAQPHIVVRGTEEEDQIRFVEIFTWVKPPDQAPENVQDLWKQEEALCEARRGHRGIEGGEVEMIAGQ